MKLYSYDELDADARSHASSVNCNELTEIAKNNGREAAMKQLGSWKFLEDGTRVEGVQANSVFHTTVIVCQGKPYPIPTIPACPGCNAPLDELESGETTHGCECGEELTAEKCKEQGGHCEQCNWLLS